MPPYPLHLTRHLTLKDGAAVTIRPIRPEDAAIEQEFVRGLSSESRYFRFMDSVRELSPQMLSHFTRVDYDLHLALIAVIAQDGRDIQIGVARYVARSDRGRCEFAVVVADAWQRRGLGTLLMRALMTAARGSGIGVMFGEILSGNHRMLGLATGLGFLAQPVGKDPRILRVEADLNRGTPSNDQIVISGN
jgi:acetyltransferase